MDLKQIKQIVDLMSRSDLTEFEVEEEGFKIKIKRGAANSSPASSHSANPFPPVSLSHETPAPRAAAPAPATVSAPVAGEMKLGSPM